VADQGIEVAQGEGMKDLIGKVEQWGRDRCIIPNSTPQAQLLKSMSEMGELADATLKSDTPEIIDGVGDVLVTLILYAALQGIDIEACLASAYDTIKDRKGTLTKEGVFVKA
jgi:NTP pyrophosphatase (non-canonical NTP hydrolase)